MYVCTSSTVYLQGGTSKQQQQHSNCRDTVIQRDGLCLSEGRGFDAVAGGRKRKKIPSRCCLRVCLSESVVVFLVYNVFFLSFWRPLEQTKQQC